VSPAVALGLGWLLVAGPALALAARAVRRRLADSGPRAALGRWLARDLAVALWLLGLAPPLAAGGLALTHTQLAALGAFALAALAFDFVLASPTAAARRHERALVCAAGAAVIAGVVLWYAPSRAVVLVDWPCRAEQWAFERARRARDHVRRTRGAHTDEAHALDARVWDEFAALERCRGRAPAEVEAELARQRQTVEELRRRIGR